MKLKLIIILLFAVIITPSFAAKKKTFALSKRVHSMLQDVNTLFEQDDYLNANIELDTMLKRKLSPYEKAQIWYMKGNAYYQLNKLPQSADAFEKVVYDPDNIPELLRQGTLRTLTQLNLGLDRIEKATRFAEQLLLETSQPEIDYALYAQILYRADHFNDAAVAIEQSVIAYQNKGKIPKENTLLLQNAIYFSQQKNRQMLIPLEMLIKHYPKPTYLLYLASVYGQLGDTEKQTVLMETLYEDNQLKKSSQFINLASLYMSENVPVKGAVVLTKAMADNIVEKNKRNLELLSQAWLMAAEYDDAIATLGKAAKLSDNGNLYLRQAYLLYDRFKWQLANSAIDNALDKGFEEQNKIGESQLLKAMVLFNLEQFDQAIKACQKAAQYQKTKKLAGQWINYISSEQQKFIKLSEF